jgi:hypothetical protein
MNVLTFSGALQDPSTGKWNAIPAIDRVLPFVLLHTTTDWTTVVRSLPKTKNFSCSLCVQTSCEAHPASYPMGTFSFSCY